MRLIISRVSLLERSELNSPALNSPESLAGRDAENIQSINTVYFSNAFLRRHFPNYPNTNSKFEPYDSSLV
jgi:hypothetical protein